MSSSEAGVYRDGSPDPSVGRHGQVFVVAQPHHILDDAEVWVGEDGHWGCWGYIDEDWDWAQVPKPAVELDVTPHLAVLQSLINPVGG